MEWFSEKKHVSWYRNAHAMLKPHNMPTEKDYRNFAKKALNEIGAKNHPNALEISRRLAKVSAFGSAARLKEASATVFEDDNPAAQPARSRLAKLREDMPKFYKELAVLLGEGPVKFKTFLKAYARQIKS